jgi:glycosyltransferase XagB
VHGFVTLLASRGGGHHVRTLHQPAFSGRSTAADGRVEPDPGGDGVQDLGRMGNAQGRFDQPLRQRPVRHGPNLGPNLEHAVSQEYAFLLKRCVDAATLARAEALAVQWQVAPHAVLIALGWLQEHTYVQALAAHWGVPAAVSEQIVPMPRGPAERTDWFAQFPLDLPEVPLAITGRPGQALTIFDATSCRPMALAARIGQSNGGWRFCALAGRMAIEAALHRILQRPMLDRATWGLHRLAPDYSAASQMTRRQAVRVGTFAGLAVGTIAVAPEAAVLGWSMLMTIPFMFVVGVRLLAVLYLLLPSRRAARLAGAARHLSDAELPLYTLLVPLFREAHMLPPLVAALCRIDYPQAKLDIRIVLEEADPQTQAVAAGMDLPGHISVVVVPDRQPRTKPKALNYALQLARGDLVAIYDAEDAPEPDQLRKAVAAFQGYGVDTACLQAQLNIHNRNASWLSRQFTLEYCALFDALLPCLARLGLPLPLGGTSNHFRRKALMACGGWDPFNVTEDADLGLRLHRLGWRTGVIASTTYEEAPQRWSVWLPQRTRWLKGWMQTYLVHTRGLDAAVAAPASRGRRLSAAFGVHVLLGGLLLSVLVHPIVYILLISELVSGHVFSRPDSLMGAGFWHIAIANFVIGFAASLLLSAITSWRRGYRALAFRVVMMPVYWLLISIAGYRAVWQLVRNPYLWEKTSHLAHPSTEE